MRLHHAFALLLAAHRLAAQGVTTAEVQGTVTSREGSPIDGAVVSPNGVA